MAKLKRPRTVQVIVTAISLSVLAAAGTIAFSASTADQLDTSNNDKNSVVEKGTQQADTILDLCARGDSVAKTLAAAGLCKASQDFKADPVVQSASPAATAASVAVPDSQVRAILEDYFARNNPRPTVQEVLDLVNQVYSEHPPAPGPAGKDAPPVSAEQRAADVAAFCADDRCKGSDGKDATPEMVATQVGAYCDAHNQCAGPEGPAGQKGDMGPKGEKGDTGARGPICEDGYHPEDMQSADDPPRMLRVCVRDGATTTPPDTTTSPPTS